MALFERTTIDRYLGYFPRRCWKGWQAGDAAAQRVDRLSMLPEAERQKVLVRVERDEARSIQHKQQCKHELFEEQVETGCSREAAGGGVRRCLVELARSREPAELATGCGHNYLRG